MMKRCLKLVCVAVLAAGSIQAQEPPAPAVEAKKPRVLLAWEDTTFKNQLIEKMAALLGQQGREVVKVEHTKRGLNAKASDYDAVFITNSGVHSKVRPWIVEWLKANEARAARIVLHTTQTSNWRVEAPGVDAVTSASTRANIDAWAADYVARLNQVLTSATE